MSNRTTIRPSRNGPPVEPHMEVPMPGPAPRTTGLPHHPPSTVPDLTPQWMKDMRDKEDKAKKERESQEVKVGRTAASLKPKQTQFFWEPWFFQGRYHLLVGQPGTGKSTFSTFLAGRAKNPIILPGKEEDLEEDLLPRLMAAGIDPNKVILLDEGDWVMPEALPRLERQIRLWGSNFLLADPIITYLPAAWNENDYKPVRAFGEAWASLGYRTGATIVGVFHPGKNPLNILPGNRAWREVPRVVVELVQDSGPLGRRFIRSYKNSKGKVASPMYYDLVDTGCGAAKFVARELMDEKAVALAKEVTDEVERSFIEVALELLPEILKHGQVDSEKVYQIGEQHKLHPKVMGRAALRLGVIKERGRGEEKFKMFWSLPAAEDTSTPFDGV